MAKYINADKAKNGIMKFVNEYGEIVGMSVTDFNILLERCAADAEEVVRCRDCKHRGYQYHDFRGTEIVVCWKDGYGIRKNANGYCDDGDFDEKEGEQDD